MRKYIIFLILLSIVKNQAYFESCTVAMGGNLYRDKCMGEDGTYLRQFQTMCYACIEAPRVRITWGGSYDTQGYLTGKICPQYGFPYYVWAGTYPSKALYAIRKFSPDTGYSASKTELKRLETLLQFPGVNPCGPSTTTRYHSLATRHFVSCIYTLRCQETHAAKLRLTRVKSVPPPRHPPHVPLASSALVDFDDMLHYYIGGISDYLNNEYTDYDGYDLDDQFEEMLTDVYMEGYKAGLNVERKWS
eukprot:361180_1